MRINFRDLVERVKCPVTLTSLFQGLISFKDGLIRCLINSDKTFTQLLYHLVNLVVGLTLVTAKNSIDNVMKGILSITITIPTWAIGLLFIISAISGLHTVTSKQYTKYTQMTDGLLPVALWGGLTYYTLVFSKFHYGIIAPHVFWLAIPLSLYMFYPHTEVRKEYG